MTDYFSRLGNAGQPDFEIELIGEGGSFEPQPAPRDDDQRSGRRWGAVAGLAALGAIGLVVAASVVMQITTDEGADRTEPASTTLELDLPAPVASAPPETLDVGALGEFDMPEARYPPMVSAPTPLQQQIPGFPVVPGSADEDLSAYDLAAAAANNMPGAEPQRSMFNVVGSSPTGSETTGASVPPPLRATATSEPGSARDAVTVERGGYTSHLIVDRPGEVVYALRPEDNGNWTTLEPSIVLAGTGTVSLNDLFDAFVTGPITPAALEHATITPSEGLMRIIGGGYARRFDVEVPIEYLRPYGALAFANVSDFTVDADAVPHSITFQVYVNGEARLALVTSNFTVGPQTFVLSQFFDRRPTNVRIELPNAQLATDPPVTTAR